MGMSSGGPSGSVKAEPNVTPMIDVMLVLLIIFMIVTPLINAGFAAQPPTGINLKSHPEDPDDQVLGIDRDGQYYLNKRAIKNETLAEQLKAIFDARTTDKILYLKADKDLQVQQGAGCDRHRRAQWRASGRRDQRSDAGHLEYGAGRSEEAPHSVGANTMSMSTGGGGGLTNDINVTPMIDVLLVLLIIFMMTIPMMRKAIDLQLPDPTPQNTPQGPPAPQIVLQVLPGGVFKINSEDVTQAGLAARLKDIYDQRPEKIIFVKGDPAVKYQDVVMAMDAARGAGVKVIGIPPK